VLTDGILKAIGSEKNDYKAACLNVEQSVNVISSNLHVDNEEFLVQGAVYDVEDGHVDWL
jgi:carbonic anhydrase